MTQRLCSTGFLILSLIGTFLVCVILGFAVIDSQPLDPRDPALLAHEK